MRRERTRARLVEAAAKLFYSEGIHATGVDRVIAEAGISKPTLYQHFRSKRELVEAVIAHWSARREDDLNAIAANARKKARERILDVFRYYEAWFEDARFRGCGLVNAAVELSSPDAPGRELVRAHKARVTDLLAELASEAGARRARELARSLALLLEGATVAALVSGDATAGRSARLTADRLIAAALPA